MVFISLRLTYPTPMSSNPPIDPKQALQYHCASQEIDLQFCQWPEIRFELVNGQFLVGGTIDGSRWLLKEALLGWGLEAAIAFAPLDQWWNALRQAHGLSCQSDTDWLTWADSLPLSSDYRDYPRPLFGSKYAGEHRWVRDHLRPLLSAAVSQTNFGYCAGPNYGMQLGPHMLTPDMLVLTTEQMKQDIFHNYYVETAAHLVIEIVMPEQRAVDEQDRHTLYEQAQIPHYWIVDPVERQFTFWQWTTDGYQSRNVDPDGCYRGVTPLSFSPDLFWLRYDQHLSPYDRTLPAFTGTPHPRRWHLEEKPGIELSYGTVPFAPVVGLKPQPISVEQFVSWCPETKLEGPPFPLLGGEEGTRNAIAMILMSLGLVETVKLISGYEWVRALRHIARQQQSDPQQRELWWQHAREIAKQLKTVHGVGGIGIIGALVDPLPLNRWSDVHFIIWDVPETFDTWKFYRSLPKDLPISIDITEAGWALPGVWQEISTRMQVLEGEWGVYGPRPRKRMRFRWIKKVD